LVLSFEPISTVCIRAFDLGISVLGLSQCQQMNDLPKIYCLIALKVVKNDRKVVMDILQKVVSVFQD